MGSGNNFKKPTCSISFGLKTFPLSKFVQPMMSQHGIIEIIAKNIGIDLYMWQLANSSLDHQILIRQSYPHNANINSANTWTL